MLSPLWLSFLVRLTVYIVNWPKRLTIGQSSNELPVYLDNVEGPVSLVLDLRVVHDRFGSTSDPSINGHFVHYPDDMDRTLNGSGSDQNLQYCDDYNNRPSHVIS